MQQYSNESDIPLALAVFLASDTYDAHPNTISATALIRPIRPLVLAERVPKEDAVIDVSSVVQARLGTAIHDGVERAWRGDYRAAMQKLGLPASVIERVRVNPSKEELRAHPEAIPVYTERRLFREISVGGRTTMISGKPDLIADGALEDYKSTTTFTYTHNTREEAQVLQGSIYRWLAPDLVTSDILSIHYIFTDWAPYKLRSERNYPPSRIVTVKHPLMSLAEIQTWIRHKLELYLRLKDADEAAIPLCSDKDLWRRPPVWKYYKNPETYRKGGRSTKNFDSNLEAYQRLHAEGNIGLVVESGGEVAACKYCPAFSACSQKDALIADGALVL